MTTRRRLKKQEVEVEAFEPNEQIIRELTEALQHARDGYVRHFAFICIERGVSVDAAKTPTVVVSQFFDDGLKDENLFDAIAGLHLLTRDVQDLAEREKDAAARERKARK